jgi:triphosphoribosyl-dephospho-CoA synthetase
MDTQDLPAPETFKKLQVLGRRAEGTMYEATDGVNTHKGAVFSLGILCAALGRLPRAAWSDPETVLAECGKETAGLTEAYFPYLTKENARTAGEILYVRHGIRGVRGQAEDGFPAVLRYGLPVLEEGLAKGLSLNDAGCAALLHMMVHETDTNMIKRSDLATYDRVINEVRGILEKNRFPGPEMLAALDERFIAMNLSPGGTADLLAMTYFLHFLKNA